MTYETEVQIRKNISKSLTFFQILCKGFILKQRNSLKTTLD